MRKLRLSYSMEFILSTMWVRCDWTVLLGCKPCALSLCIIFLYPFLLIKNFYCLPPLTKSSSQLHFHNSQIPHGKNRHGLLFSLQLVPCCTFNTYLLEEFQHSVLHHLSFIQSLSVIWHFHANNWQVHNISHIF